MPRKRWWKKVCLRTKLLKDYEEPPGQSLSTESRIYPDQQREHTGHWMVSNPYRSKKELIQIVYDVVEFPDLAGTNNQSDQLPQGNHNQQPAQQPAQQTLLQRRAQQPRGFGNNHPRNYGPQLGQQQLTYCTAATSAPGTVPAKASLVRPGDKGNQAPQPSGKTNTGNNCSMADDATTIASNGATTTTTTTTLNSMFSSFQVEMAKVMEGMFKQFAANQGTEAILNRLLKLEQATLTATPSGTQTEQAMARILDRLDEDKAMPRAPPSKAQSCQRSSTVRTRAKSKANSYRQASIK
jgi:hypothetical protein